VWVEARAVSHHERIVPDEVESGVVALHLKRYDFALPYCRAKVVLDAGCGVGYGSALLAEAATRVVGVDVSDAAIDYARERYAAANLEFETMDVMALALEDGSFDVVCAFETIEHVEDRDAFLREIARVLRLEGVLLVSTPRADETTEQPDNPFHHVELSRADFERLLGRHFQSIELYGQRRLQTRRHRALLRLDVLGLRRRLPALARAAPLVGSPATSAVTLDDIVIEREGIERASELVAVCTRPRP
jgi:SAM-dependent methyltransferase